MTILDKNEVTVVTSFNERLWQTYAKDTFPTVVDKVECNEIIVYQEFNHEVTERSSDPKVTYDKIRDSEFYRFVRNFDYLDSTEFKYQAARFAPKAFAIHEAKKRVKSGWLVWIDADVVALSQVNKEQWNAWLNHAISYLPRPKSMGYAETGFIGFNLNRSKVHDFLDKFRNIYVERTLFNESQWHDAWILTRLIEKEESDGLKTSSLTNLDRPHVFENSRLSRHLKHHKGPKKFKK